MQSKFNFLQNKTSSSHVNTNFEYVNLRFFFSFSTMAKFSIEIKKNFDKKRNWLLDLVRNIYLYTYIIYMSSDFLLDAKGPLQNVPLCNL